MISLLLKHNNQKRWNVLAFLLCASYAIIKQIKFATFSSMIGIHLLPYVQILSSVVALFFILAIPILLQKNIPTKFIYNAWLIYSLATIVSSLCLRPFPNTAIFNWLFHIIVDQHSTITICMFWALANSFYSNSSAKKSYGTIILYGQIGDICASLTSWLILVTYKINPLPWLPIISALCLLIAMHILKQLPIKATAPQQKTQLYLKENKLLFHPYVLGVFGMYCSYKLIALLLEYHLLLFVAQSYLNNITTMSAFLFQYNAGTQALGALIIFFVFPRMHTWSINIKLALSPMLISIASLPLIFYPGLFQTAITLALFSALYNGITYPSEKILFIPTISSIRFQAKATMGTFGKNISGYVGNAINILCNYPGNGTFIFKFILLIGISWTTIAFLIGEKYTTTANNNTLIGID